MMVTTGAAASVKFPFLAMFGVVLVVAQLAVLPVSVQEVFTSLQNINPNTESDDRNHADQQQNFRVDVPSLEGNIGVRSGSSAKSKSTRPADGTFNGMDIYLNPRGYAPIHSSVECVGENFVKAPVGEASTATDWIHRSCKFQHFCFDIEHNEFVIYQSPEEQKLQEMLRTKESSKFIDYSSSSNVTVSLGGVNAKWTWKSGVPRLEWFPKVIVGQLTETYYEVDPDVVWIPFHSLAGFNPGHLVWDDFLPIYTLFKSFFPEDHHSLQMMRYILPGEGMWATCDMNENKQKDCANMFSKFLPLMGQSQESFTTNQDTKLQMHDANKKPESNLICARHGAAGLGMLTDHGTKLHGWHDEDYHVMHNHGRGSHLWKLRNFMVENILGDAAAASTSQSSSKPPYKIVFSVGSSKTNQRNMDFSLQQEAVRKEFGDMVEVQAVKMKNLPLKEQVQLASQASIYISVCGGGAVTATFLPRGASLFLYYDEDGGQHQNVKTFLPARLDWDLLNNLGYVRTHWLPTHTRDDDIPLLVQLIRHELDIISHQ